MKKRKAINWERWHWLRQHLKQVRKSPEPEEPQVKMAHFLTTLFAAIPIITASIYLSGMAHFYGRCLVHGLDIAEFPQPADITLATGYLLWLQMGKLYGPYLLYAVAGIVLLTFVLFLSVRLRLRWAWFCHRIGSRQYPRTRRFFRRRARVPAPRLFLLISWVEVIYNRFAILVVPALIILLPTLSNFMEGLDAEKARVTKLENDQLSERSDRALSPLLGETAHIRVMCNTSHCAYRLKGGEMKLVRHDQVELVRWMAPVDDANKPAKEDNMGK
ncbi:hypothetical protein [Aeromonas sp. FDAARGOS 1407]|uniref:hypothetical protein n=1 Tax=Aeromonas TaxID=642 RepID=UPI001C2121F3|nr:hypothetical protein [Aeromonas sp. FDAARGOS 1407]QXC33405.1 hypothetical protein I6L37_17820 [Aeromonas sp. FDAARGOS 1407]